MLATAEVSKLRWGCRDCWGHKSKVVSLSEEKTEIQRHILETCACEDRCRDSSDMFYKPNTKDCQQTRN